MFVDIFTREDPKAGIPRKHIWGGFMTEIPEAEDTIRLHKEFEDRVLLRRFDLITGTVELELEANFLNLYTDIGEREEVDREEPGFPIETAPKDGTEILVCRAADAWWEGEEDWVVYCSLVKDPVLFFIPTLWKHLPKNPYWRRKE